MHTIAVMMKKKILKKLKKLKRRVERLERVNQRTETLKGLTFAIV